MKDEYGYILDSDFCPELERRKEINKSLDENEQLYDLEDAEK